MMDDDVLLHLIDRLKQAKIQDSPYPYFYLENIFPEEFYEKLVGKLPDPSSFQVISQAGTVTPGAYLERLILPLEDAELCKLPFSHFLFWNNFSNAIKSDLWNSTLLEKFAPQIKQRFGSYEKIKFSSTAELIRDRTNYSIGPHTDHPARVITMLFYFPRSKEQAHLGTSIYQATDPSFECEGLAHHSFAGFKKLYTAPFLPNSVFGFIKSNRSFHGREQILDKDIERNLMTYYLKWQFK